MNTRPAHRSCTLLVVLSCLLLAAGCASLPSYLLLAGGTVYLAAGFDLTGAEHSPGSPSHLAALMAADDCASLLVRGETAGTDCSVTGGWDLHRGAYHFDYLFDSPEDLPFTVRLSIVAEPWGPARVDAVFADERVIKCVDGVLTGPAIYVGPCAAIRIATGSTHVTGTYSTTVSLVVAEGTRRPAWRVSRSPQFEQATYICEVDAETGTVLRERRQDIEISVIRLPDNDV